MTNLNQKIYYCVHCRGVVNKKEAHKILSQLLEFPPYAFVHKCKQNKYYVYNGLIFSYVDYIERKLMGEL